MKIKKFFLEGLVTVLLLYGVNSVANAADVVPNEIQMPGTQPMEVPERMKVDDCKGCHGEYDPAVEPQFNWQGSMMAHATRDPLFWSAMAIAEQTFDGAGDLCIRCHTPNGWLAGRSTPTDGSALKPEDADGVTCHTCHTMTNPDNSEHLGVQTAPFIANDGGTPAKGYYGSGQYSVLHDDIRLGPYASLPTQPHDFAQSQFHRSVDFCGTCHDVSNPLVGDLAPNHGAQIPLQAGTFSGSLGTAVSTKAAFNNFPYQYGVVERTFSEYKASALSTTPVSSYNQLPADLQAGRISEVYQAALAAGTNGNYEDGTTRYYTCQSCHMMPVTGQGCNENPPTRSDLPSHDLTGGNYWMPDAIKYLDSVNKLRIGDPLTDFQKSAMTDGVLRAKATLSSAGTLSVTDNTVRITNLTGHKLISGYPEGRRMWLNIKWYDGTGGLLREDGTYGDLTVDINGTPTVVRTLLDLTGTNTRIYEAHSAITQGWAAKLLTLGVAASTPLVYDRVDNSVVKTLGQLATDPPGSYQESFHFVLNNKVAKDNRIPPWRMNYDEAAKRNALPVPATQYGNPGAGGDYDHWDDFILNPPAGATTATVNLMYQPTSWEYVQFLYLSNNKQNTFLASEGDNMLEAWQNTGMSEPYVMATTTWAPPPDTDGDGLLDSFEVSIGTNPNLADTDGDGISDYAEVAYDGDASTYTPGVDLNPLSADSDNDTVPDGSDPLPLVFNHKDGDLAPWGAPDNQINAGDLLIANQLVLGQRGPGQLQYVHGDMNADGVIDLTDLLLIQKAVLP